MRQDFWQVHSPPPKPVNRPHYQVTIPNEMHQFDLLYMPSDMLYGNMYKYILSGTDVASRYKVTRPLRTKQGKGIACMIADIYKVGPLTYPKVFQCNNGGEFKADMVKYKHTHMAFIEALNKLLAEQLFKVQDAQELNDPEKVSSTWIKHLYGLVDRLNNTETQMTGMKPMGAIGLKEVPLVNRENYPPEDMLPEDVPYCTLIYYNLVKKNMTTSTREPLIGHGLRRLTD